MYIAKIKEIGCWTKELITFCPLSPISEWSKKLPNFAIKHLDLSWDFEQDGPCMGRRIDVNNAGGLDTRLHTTLYGSAAGCRSIQKRCAFWKHGLTSKNIQSHLTYFCKSNINQIFTNGGGMIWGVRIAIFTEIRHLVEELITFLSIFGPQKLGILTARLNKSLSISTLIQWEGISVLKHAQSLHSYCENNSFWKTLWWNMWAMMHASKVRWIGITVCRRACEQQCKVTWIGIIVFCNRMEDMPLYIIFSNWLFAGEVIT